MIHDLDVGRGNIDIVVVGPTGVFVIETKAWIDPVRLTERGRLFVGGRDEERAVKRVHHDTWLDPGASSIVARTGTERGGRRLP